MSKKILLINDLAGYGKVALSAMIPVLSHLKYETFNLPTAIVSNTLDYGKFDILETTDYMRNTIDIWQQLGFEFDGISTGFIVSKQQTQLIIDFCRKKGASGSIIFTDPIMGDDGRLYNGITEDTVKLMKKLVGVADYITPNYTEAAYLTDIPYRKEGTSIEELHQMIKQLRELNAKSVVITSAMIKGAESKCVVGYDHQTNSFFKIDYDEIPVRFPGTGDIFSAVFIGKIMAGESIYQATSKAMQAVSDLIKLNYQNVDKYKGIPLETSLEVID
ncbi:MAG: pyridoxamine kinase [Erysipelotrichaceae bacterium]